MFIRLFLDMNNLNYYDDIPDLPADHTEKAEEYPLFPSDDCYFAPDLDTINTRCDSLLDIGDVDYFDSEKCVILKLWIEERLQQPLASRYSDILKTLKSYCSRAIALGTGVVIEL